MIMIVFYKRPLKEFQFNYHNIFNQYHLFIKFFVLIKVVVKGTSMSIYIHTRNNMGIKVTTE